MGLNSLNSKVKIALLGIMIIVIAMIVVIFYKPYYLESSPEKLGQIGIDYYENNKYKDAINALTKAKKQKNIQQLEFFLALSYLKSKQPLKAFEIADKLLKTNPEDSDAYVILGSYYEINGDDEKALKNLQKAVTLESSPEANFAIGKYYYNKNNTEKAFEYLSLSQDQNPNNVELYPILADVYRKKGLFVSAYNSYDAYVQLKCKQGFPYYFLTTKEADEIQKKMKSLRDMAHEM